MKTLQINTAQNVTISFELADSVHRLIAFIIDNIIKFAYWFLIFYVFDFEAYVSDFDTDNWSKTSLRILIFFPILTYTLVQESIFSGQTIGKKMMKLKVVTLSGYRPSFTDTLIRWFMRILDFNAVFILGVLLISVENNADVFYSLLGLLFVFGKLVGFLMISMTPKNQRLGDIVADTLVIQTKDNHAFSDTILEDLAVDYKPTYPRVIHLSDNDARIIKGTFIQAKKGKDYATIKKLRAKIEQVTEIHAKDVSDVFFIDTVLKDYNYFTKDM